MAARPVRFVAWSLAILACAGPASGALAATAPDLHVARSTQKILASTLLDALPVRADVDAVRNEWVAFQVVVRAGDTALAGVDAAVSDLAGAGTIPASAATLYLEHYHTVTTPSVCDVVFNMDCADHPEYVRTPGDYPDALVPLRDPWGPDPTRAVGAGFGVPAAGFATLFVDVMIPIDAPHGTYSGTLTVTAGGQAVGTIPIGLTVWDVTLPSERTVSTAYGFGPGGVADYHAGDAATLDRIGRNYEIELHRHRVDVTDLNPGLNFTFDAGGNLQPIDFTAYDAYMSDRLDGKMYPDGVPARRFNTGMFRPGSGAGSMTDDEYGAAAIALAQHLQAKGWLDKAYLYSWDEPWMPAAQAAGSFAAINADVERLRKYTDLWNGHALVTSPWMQQMDAVIDIWCPVTAMYGHDFWPVGQWPEPEKYVELRASGHEVWFYACNANFPPLLGYDTDSPYGQEPRLLQWGAWHEGANGFLYWEVAFWQDDPWNVLDDIPGFGEEYARNGDGVLFYPGDHTGTKTGLGSPAGVSMDGPAVSLRLKEIRDGMEDWELFRIADALGGGGYARAQVERAFTAFGHPLDDTFDDANRPWALDDSVMEDARRNIVLKIQYLQHPDEYADPEPPAADGVESAEAADAADAADVPAEAAAEAVAEPSPDAVGPAPDAVADTASPHDVPVASDVAAADSRADVAAVAASGGGGCVAGHASSAGSSGLFLLALAGLAAFRRPARLVRH